MFFFLVCKYILLFIYRYKKFERQLEGGEKLDESGVFFDDVI